MSNKFPQLEWINVDGRQVPVPKVQHYKKGSTTETELTGHDNPFPVANYTQNSNGLWMPVSMDNPVPTQLTGSIVEDDYVRTQSTGYRVVNQTVELDSDVIEPDEVKNIPIDVDGARKIVILVTFNKSWKGSISTLTSTGASDTKQNIYPDVYTESQRFRTGNYPQRIVVGLGVEDAENELDAINRAYIHKGRINFLLRNVDNEMGVALIRVVRIWEG